MKLIITIFTLLLFSAGIVNAQTADKPLGSGTQADPYQIATLNNLYWIAVNTNVGNYYSFSGYYFIQTADIDASSTQNWFLCNGLYAGWIPIGTSTCPFQGNYDGNGKKILNLYVLHFNYTVQILYMQYFDNTGLFGYTSGATISNLGISNIIRCAFGKNVGSLIGNAVNTRVTNCYSIQSGSGAFEGSQNVGGLIGSATQNCSITNCYTSAIEFKPNTNDYNYGGLIGFIDSSTTVTNCYSTGCNVQGYLSVGGLVGVSQGTITNCYSANSITANSISNIPYLYAGGFAGNNQGGTISGCFWNTDLASAGLGNNESSSGLTGLNTSQLKASFTTYINAGWSGDWCMDSYNSGYPYLYFQDTTGIPFSSYPHSGLGTSASPYQISDLSLLNWLSQVVANGNSLSGLYFIQTSDIDASATATWNSDGSGGYYGWLPIGNSSTAFSGTYNGNNKVINNLTVNRSSTNDTGLFGRLSGGYIELLGLENVTINGYSNSGALVGVLDNTSTISKCYTTGVLSGNDALGGLVGLSNNSSLIDQSYSTVTVNGTYGNIGGLLGWQGGISFTVNSYYIGTVTGVTYTGGVVGSNPAGIVNNCYAAAKVTGTSTGIGALCGYNASKVGYSMWDNTLTSTGIGIDNGGKYTQPVSGYSPSLMKTESTYTNAGWDFTSTWSIQSWCNGGYPHLIWEKLSYLPTTQANNITFPSVTYCNMNISWTSGNGTDRAVFVTQGSSGTTTPSDSTTYTANTNFQSGTQIGTSGWYCVYNGTGSNVTIAGLSASTGYRVQIFEYNGGAGSEQYLDTTSTNNPNNVQTPALPSGDGTSGNPYKIGSLSDLYWVSQNSSSWNSQFIQTADIDASSTSNWNSGQGFAPIGNMSTRFGGIYDGGGHIISNLTIALSSGEYVGLFGSEQGVIKNIGLTNENILGYQYVGGLVGISWAGTISECFTTGNISGIYGVGGLVGWSINGSSINNSYSNSSVKGSNNTNGSHYVGGLVGNNYGQIDNCYAAGTVSSWQNDGGLVETNTGTVSNSFWDVTTSGIGVDGGTTGSAGGTGESTTNMKTKSTFLNVSWDPSIWYMDVSINNGYPYLYWQNTGGSPMPVELSSFNAECGTQNVELKWATATEVNNYGFDIERSQKSEAESQNVNWENIGFVKGAGNSNSPKSYSFVANNPLSGKAEYRLKQIDNDGTFKYSPVVDVTSLPAVFSLGQNFPNPFNPTTTISYALPKDSKVVLEVYSITGQKVATLVNGEMTAGLHSAEFNGSSLASGIYFYRITAGSFNEVKKLMLLK